MCGDERPAPAHPPWPPAGTRPLSVDVVSVQSQVIYGRVGNAVAVPTLAARGLTVAAVPTVLLSNTPHYASLHGGSVPEAWFEGWLEDLVARGALARLRAIETGYLGSPAQARALAAWIRGRLAEAPALRIVVDPVIGDYDHGVYVDPALVDAYRRELLPRADGLTPNDFELAHLTGRAIASLDDAVAAARGLLAGRTQWVVVTSAVPARWPDARMRLLVVTRDRAHVIEHARVDCAAKGAGDLFTAALTAAWLRGDALPDAAIRASRAVLAAMRATRDAHGAELVLPPPDAGAGEAVTVSPCAGSASPPR